MLEKLRTELYKLHMELYHSNLVYCSNGNISVRAPLKNLVMIKPSGIDYPDLNPKKMIILNLEGKVIEGSLHPSVDTLTHLYLYRNRNDINGIVHTHSIYATAFAAAGKSIPPVLTSIAEEFCGPIPCSNYAPVGDESIGKEILTTIGKSGVVLLKHHGLFAIGKTPKEALNKAIKTENIAKTIYTAQQIGFLEELPLNEIEKIHYFHKKKYGQKNNNPINKRILKNDK